MSKQIEPKWDCAAPAECQTELRHNETQGQSKRSLTDLVIAASRKGTEIPPSMLLAYLCIEFAYFYANGQIQSQNTKGIIHV
ncbi:hypothetical protein ACPV4H_16860 [Vibrio rotiferianus]|uniref:hypothetical protein n=1 Tax=Vibrio rotiferianus TaxID=190895 RepID=UPI00406A9AB0